MLSPKNSGKWFRRVEEAAAQYMKRCFATEKEMRQNDERLRYKLRGNLRRRWA